MEHFSSFIMGGFECSTHRDRARRLDLIRSTRHDEFALADYQRLLSIGMKTARDGVRWHLIESEPGRYDFSSLEAQVQAAKDSKIQILWDLFHYGCPDGLSPFSDEFVPRFVRFAAAVSTYLADRLGPDVVICPVNEISFFAWIAGSKGIFYPFAQRRGSRLKRLLIEATTASVKAIRHAVPTAKFMISEPAIHVVPRDSTPAARRAAQAYRLSQFEALDGILTADPDAIDTIGLNFYFHNQWRHPSRRKIPRGHPEYRPLNEILGEFYERYRKPLMIAETGIEDEPRPDWFRYVCDEVAIAMERGIPMTGICLYPIVNHPGWADDRHCHNGLWDYADDLGNREIFEPLAEEIRKQIRRFEGQTPARELIQRSQAS